MFSFLIVFLLNLLKHNNGIDHSQVYILFGLLSGRSSADKVHMSPTLNFKYCSKLVIGRLSC